MPKKRLPASSSAASLLLASPSSSSVRGRFWLGLKVVGVASALFCVLALLRIQQEFRSTSLYLEKVRTAAEEAQTAATSLAPFEGAPKVAFLFLARAGLPLDFLWHAFFQNGDAGKFSIYIHSKPGFIFDESTTRSPHFYGRQLTESVKVAWGESSMIEAERLLLRAALGDLSNQRFALISDRCVPLHNFSYIYNYLMSSSKSFIDSFLDVKEDRYNPKMFPTIPKEKWRKGSQWATLVRKHAEVVIADDIVFPVFKRHCKLQRWPALDLGGSRKAQKVTQKEHDCIPDEHYIQTLFSMTELEDELERRTVTYTFWNHTSSRKEKQDWHPITFEYADANPRHIKEIKDIKYVYYETEYRTEWCRSNATPVPCFLFARKFAGGAAMRLLYEGIVGPFDPTTLLPTS
uniref:Protein translocase subunit SecA 1 n=2 Tax=Anthurium amnicola TaxID=1678845 RepID=A0A1D1XVY1_9ARAE